MESMAMSHMINVKDFLLNEGDYKGYSSKLIGTKFQAKLRKEKRDKSYRCPVCKGYGFLLSKGSQAAMEKDLEILADLSAASLAKFLGLSEKDIQRKDGKGVLSGTTIAYRKIPMFKKIHGIMGILSHHKKIIDANVKKEEITLKDDVKEAEKTFERIEKTAKHYIGVCQYCAGNGWLDIGHKDLEGKTVKLLLWVFNNYALKGIPEVKVSDLWKEFSNITKYPIEPQWANSPGLDPVGLEKFDHNYVVNRFTDYTTSTSNAWRSLKDRFIEFYKNGGGDLKEEEVLTYEAVSRFFPYLVDSRVKTGTLHEFLLEEQKSFNDQFNKVKAHFNKVSSVTHVINPQTHKVEHRLPVDRFFFRGPTSWDRRKKGSKIKTSWKNKLFVYASIYSGTYKPWNNQYLHSIAEQFFSSTQMDFLKFFPQEYIQK